MFHEKPVISNQHGALAMAVLPFLYGMFKATPSWQHLSLGLAWFFLYLFSYPFLALFSKKPTARNQKWAVIYFGLSLISGLPVLWYNPSLLYFLIAILLLGLVQIHFAKKRDERHLLNDIAGIFTFGIMGVASFYLNTNQLNGQIFLHPTLFFIATTFYVKSMVRERRNPIYMELSIGLHLLLAMGYLFANYGGIFTAYLIATARAILIPSFGLNVKQVGMLEFITLIVFLIGILW